MKCRLCKWLCDWACGPETKRGNFWDASREWEQDHSNEWDLWIADDESVRARNERANELFANDPSSAFALFKVLADNGSPWAMRQTGFQYQIGLGAELDFAKAEQYYYKGLLAGSWMAALHLANLLFGQRINEKWETILENGVESDFIPANFWLAWYRYKRSPRRQTALEVRPIIERAAEVGHPGARMVLARWKASGKYGLSEMRQGLREFSAVVGDFRAGTLKDSPKQKEVAAA